MPDLIVFNILIPLTENATGFVHPPDKFDDWVLEVARRFGGISVMGVALRGLWFDETLPHDAHPVEDHNNWYKVGVAPGRVDELRQFVKDTAHDFGQKCLYFERAGEADFVWDPPYDPATLTG